jgi:hypothetical protein
MTDLENDVRTALGRHAGPIALRPMPPGTRRRVRVRQAGFVALIALATAFAVAGGVILAGTLPHGRGTNPADDGYSSPLENVPPGWPSVQISDPSSAYLPPIADPNVSDGPVVLASGTVEGSAFTLYAYTRGRGDAATPCLGFVGFPTVGEPVTTAPDIVTCANAPAVPQQQDVAFIGAGSSERPDLEANFGFVSGRVDKIYVWGGGDLGMFEIQKLQALRGWDVAPFFFVPSAGAGPLEVDAIGRDTILPLAHAEICHASSASGSCRTDVHQEFPLGSPVDVPVPLAAGSWPRVTFGGDFEPYVDHVVNADGVVDPGVVGTKTVIAYGTVQGAPWSLVAFNMRDAGAPDGLNPSSELFVTGVGGGGSALHETSPWSPNDLGGSHGLVEPGGFDDITGVVSSRVSTVRVVLSDGTIRDADLIQGPQGVDASYFVMFLPARSEGRLVALDAEGNEIEQMCLRDMMGVAPGGDPCAP